MIGRRQLLAAAAGACLLCTAPPLAAQQFGQWSWDGILAASGRSYDNSVDGRPTSEYDERQLRLGLGLNGFIVHPAIADFRLALAGAITDYGEGATVDNDRYEGRIDLGLLPRGAYPLRLYYQVSTYDYQEPVLGDPYRRTGYADTATSYGGRFRIRKGWLRGLLAGVDHSDIQYVGGDDDGQIIDREFIQWSSPAGRLNHTVRLDHHRQEYGDLNYSFEDLVFNFGQFGQLTPSVRWDLSMVGLGRTSEHEGREGVETRTGTVRANLVKTRQRGDLVELFYSGGVSDVRGGDTLLSHDLVGRYRLLFDTGWEVSPFVGYTRQDRLDGRVEVPRAGLSSSWSGRLGGVDGLVSAQASYGRERAVAGDDTYTAPAWAGSFSGSLGAGERWRKEIEVDLAWNELRPAGEVIDELPDFGGFLTTPGRQSYMRGRLSLRRRWSQATFHAYSEWLLRDVDLGTEVAELRADQWRNSLNVQWRTLSLVVNQAAATVRRSADDEEELVDTLSGLLAWRPWRFLSVTASYRQDLRDLETAPDIDLERAEAGLTFHLGLFDLHGEYFETREEIVGGSERRNTGVTWTVSRRFGGWLPVVSTPERRGVIR